MHPQQKQAWLTIIIVGIAVGLTVTACLVFWICVGPKVAPAGFAFMSIMAGLALIRLPVKRSVGGCTLVFDERDEQIRVRASHLAWCITWLYWGVVCMGTWGVFNLLDGPEFNDAKVTANMLPFAYMGAAVVYTLASAVATLVFYGGSEKDEDLAEGAS